jgi:hypothetical protein
VSTPKRYAYSGRRKKKASPLNVRYGINVGITFKRLALEKLWTPVKVKSAPVATSLAADPKS